MDLIMGRFADAEIGTLAEAELAEFERLIEVPDRDLYLWLTGEAKTPPSYDTPVFRRLKIFPPHAAPIPARSHPGARRRREPRTHNHSRSQFERSGVYGSRVLASRAPG